MSSDAVKVPARVAAALKQQAKAVADLREIQLQLALKRTELAGVERRLAWLRRAASPAVQQAWCVDLTESGAGEVATIEVPGEPQQVLLAPGCRAPGPGDGVLALRELMSPEQAFFNAAILPGWQKFRPTYRVGTIVSVNVAADTATVVLDEARSSAQGLAVNQAGTLFDIPVEYMACHAAVFEPGDRCVVQFVGQRWEAPKVIGFAQWPKPCITWKLIGGNFFENSYSGHFTAEFSYAGNYDYLLNFANNFQQYTYQYSLNGVSWSDFDFFHQRNEYPNSVDSLTHVYLGFSLGDVQGFHDKLTIAIQYVDGVYEIKSFVFHFWDSDSYGIESLKRQKVFAFRILNERSQTFFKVAFNNTDSLFDVSLGAAYISGVRVPDMLSVGSQEFETFSFNFPK